jgi:hypothetical protein
MARAAATRSTDAVGLNGVGTNKLHGAPNEATPNRWLESRILPATPLTEARS